MMKRVKIPLETPAHASWSQLRAAVTASSGRAATVWEPPAERADRPWRLLSHPNVTHSACAALTTQLLEGFRLQAGGGRGTKWWLGRKLSDERSGEAELNCAQFFPNFVFHSSDVALCSNFWPTCEALERNCVLFIWQCNFKRISTSAKITENVFASESKT